VLQNDGHHREWHLVMGNKFGARSVVTAEGLRFDSQREYARWRELQLLQQAGVIEHLVRQLPYFLHARNGEQAVATYRADFVYLKDGSLVVEDVKGVKTAMYKLKRKWMKAEYGIEILET
jgi:hypothetical protein